MTLSERRTHRRAHRTHRGDAARPLTRAHALSAGATLQQVRYRLERGDWDRVYPRVYRALAHPITWRQRVLAACFACGAGSAASHRSAAALRAIPGFPERALDVTSARRHPLSGVTLFRPRSMLARAGWMLLVFTWEDLAEQSRIAETVLRVSRARMQSAEGGARLLG